MSMVAPGHNLSTLQVGTYFGYPVAIHARGYLATFAANDDYSSQERGGGVTETK